MSPNTPPAFEALPVEILGNILRRMASPEDLYSTIRASPKAFGSFLSFREGILIEVLQRHLPAEIFAEFLGLLHVPKYEDFNHVPNQSEFVYRDGKNMTEQKRSGWEFCRQDAWPIVIDTFMETHFRNVKAAKSSRVQRYSMPRPADKQQIKYIISMYGTLKRFIVDYLYFVRQNMTGPAPPLSVLDLSVRPREDPLIHNNGWAPISENEKLRLQQGFVRYEFWSRLNVASVWPAHWLSRGYSGAFDSLSKHLQRWEEEEMRCVWNYVHRQYQVLLRNIVEEFRCDVRRLSRKALFAPDHEVTFPPDISHGPASGLFCSWPQDMSSLGLPLLQQLLRSDVDDQRCFVKNTLFPSLPHDGANSIYKPIAIDFADPFWDSNPHHECEWLESAETELKDVGWAFWEERSRFEYFALIWMDPQADYPIEECIDRSGYTNYKWLGSFEVEENFSERHMLVTKEDFQGELSAKYAANSQTPGGTQFFVDRLRDISDWPSKEVSPAFQEICSGRSGTEQSVDEQD